MGGMRLGTSHNLKSSIEPEVRNHGQWEGVRDKAQPKVIDRARSKELWVHGGSKGQGTT